MKRLWAPFLLASLLLVPALTHAQSNIPLFDSEWQLVPEAHELDPSCPVGAPLGFGGFLQLIQNGMNAAISFGIVIFVLIIAFAGMLWILTPTNPENHSQAKKVLTNAVFGMVIILSSWLIVDFVMKLLYREDTDFGPWNAILTGGNYCVTASEDVAPIFDGDITRIPGTSSGGGTGSFEPRYAVTGACSPVSVAQAGQSANITEKEAKFLACIARPESTCGVRYANYNWGAARNPSTAYGPFQILLQGNARYFENSVCRQAAGLGAGESLSCASGFRDGREIPGSPIAARCKRAAANLACSTVAGVALVRESGATPWTGNNDSKPAHQRCAQELR